MYLRQPDDDSGEIEFPLEFLDACATYDATSLVIEALLQKKDDCCATSLDQDQELVAMIFWLAAPWSTLVWQLNNCAMLRDCQGLLATLARARVI